MRPPLHTSSRAAARLGWAGALIGFSLSGFFDGILLHQVLQWHHLLSGLDGDGWRDLRVQVLADGLFHVFMYLVAAAGLWLLVRSRGTLTQPGSARRLGAAALAGFGTWHVIDALVSHWWLGLHRIRMDTPQPLAWDLGWVVVFGLVPLLLAAWAARRPGRGGGAVAACALGAAAVAAAGWASRPPDGPQTVTLLLAPGTPPARAMHLAHGNDARIAWVNRAGTVWLLRVPAGAPSFSGYRDGVLAVGGRWAAACLGWSRRS